MSELKRKDKEEYNKIYLVRKDVQVEKVFFPFSSTGWIDKNYNYSGDVLDFGSNISSTTFQKVLRDKGNYFGYDVDKETISWLKKNNYFIDFWKTNKKFDFIVAIQVYEHLDLNTREKFIERAYKLLKPKGFLILEYPYIRNLGGINYFTDKTHQHPPAFEDEASLLALYKFKPRLVLVGISFWPFTNFFKLVLNMALGFDPQHNVVLIGQK